MRVLGALFFFFIVCALQANAQTEQKESLVRDIDVEDVFYVVEDEYTDTRKSSSSELLQEDYKKYSVMFPITERIRELLVREE